MLSIRRLALTATALMTMAAQGLAADYPEMTLKFGDILNRNFAYYAAIDAFKKEIEARSDGKIKVDIVTDGALGSAKDALEALQLGTVQMEVNVASYTQSIVPEHLIWDVPFIFKSREAWKKIAYGPLGQEIGDKIEPRGIKFLIWGSTGGRGFISKKPLATLADYHGVKLREQPSPVLVQTVEALGAQPVVMNLPEVYTSLAQGVLDAADVSIESIKLLKFNEVAPYYTETQHILTASMVIANLDWWNGLNKDTQDLFADVLATKYRETNDNWFSNVDPAASVEEQAKQLKGGVSNFTLVKSDIEAMRAATEPVRQKFREGIGADLFDRVQAAAND